MQNSLSDTTVITFRLIKAFDGEQLLEKHTYKKIMATLKRAKKIRIGDNEWHLIKVAPLSNRHHQINGTANNGQG